MKRTGILIFTCNRSQLLDFSVYMQSEFINRFNRIDFNIYIQSESIVSFQYLHAIGIHY